MIQRATLQYVRHPVPTPRRARRLVLAVALAAACGLQGCATSLETFGLGAGVGIVGAFGLIGCAIGCR